MAAAVSPQTVVALVDSVSALLDLLDDLANLPVSPPSLYIDLEGVQLGRHGSISILSLYLATTKRVYLVDIHILGGAAFSTTNSTAHSLKSILEAPAIPKVFFDIRNDSDALFSHYQISVAGIQDLQLMELSTRTFSQKYVAGLSKCIQNCANIPSAIKTEWQRSKAGGTRLYDPKQGGRYEIFNERPLKPEMVQYCARDVALLPELWKVYSARLAPPGQSFWRSKVKEATKERVRLSQSKGYDGQARDNVLGPWDREQIEEDTNNWNDDVLTLPRQGMVLNEDDDGFVWR